MERLPYKQNIIDQAPEGMKRHIAKMIIPEVYSASSVSDLANGSKDAVGDLRGDYDVERAKWSAGKERIVKFTELPDRLIAKASKKEFHPVDAANAIVYVPLVRHEPQKDPDNRSQITIFDVTAEQHVNMMKGTTRAAINRLMESTGSDYRALSRDAIQKQTWQSDVIVAATYSENPDYNEFLLLHVINRHVTETEKAFLLGQFARLQARGTGVKI